MGMLGKLFRVRPLQFDVVADEPARTYKTPPLIEESHLSGVPAEELARDWQPPHCDSTILHSPGKCEYCDRHPDWQAYRLFARIAFSDESSDAELAPCPSTHFRPAEVRDRWHGNIATTG
jgi:hypothetical protein